MFSVGLVNSLREPLFQNVCINKAPDLLHRKQTRKTEKLECSNADLTNYLVGPGGGE